MILISPLLSTTTLTHTMTAGVVQNFFFNLFLHPGQNVPALAAICGATVLACVGTSFVIKKIYDKYCPAVPI